jgi:hypothetical protein
LVEIFLFVELASLSLEGKDKILFFSLLTTSLFLTTGFPSFRCYKDWVLRPIDFDVFSLKRVWTKDSSLDSLV